MSESDSALDEKRIYQEARDETVAYVASGLGVSRVAVSGDQVGRVAVVHRAVAHDVAGADGRLLVASDEDVLVGTSGGFEPTAFGPAVTVGFGPEPIAAGPDGRVARLDGDMWQELGTVVDTRAIDGPFLGAESGVYRAMDGGITSLGLEGVRDVAAGGPYAATDGGLSRYEEGAWIGEIPSPCSVVAAADNRAHVVTDGTLTERGPDGWVSSDPPTAEPIVDIAYGEATYAVTVDGTFLVDAEPSIAADGRGGWRTRALGLPSVVGLAVP